MSDTGEFQPPPGAKTERAQKFWKQSPLVNIKKAFWPKDEDIEEWMVVLLESFTTEELQFCISHQYDVLPIVINRGLFEHWVYGKLVLPLVSLHWQRFILHFLGHPQNIINVLQVRDPRKAFLLSTPAGRTWLDWFCYKLLSYLKEKANIEGGGRIVPPPGSCPLRPLPKEFFPE